jgi:aspartate kinase
MSCPFFLEVVVIHLLAFLLFRFNVKKGITRLRRTFANLERKISKIMVVYKFGGASVKDAASIKHVARIIADTTGPLVVVVSAMGKTTNALEEVLNTYYNGDQATAIELLAKLRQSHFEAARAILGDEAEETMHRLNDHFVEIDWIIEDDVHDPYDYLYDQIVSIGEMASSTLLHAAVVAQGAQAAYLDARAVIVTDERHRAASVDFALTQERITKQVSDLQVDHRVVITQGFIGSTRDNNTTTLGREGSDYSAGIFSYCLDVESMHIWKDVPGILTADPRLFDNTIKIDRLSYREAIEMTYYGAKVIHPKTIKPLQNKSIHLHVRPYMQPDSEGTLINDDGAMTYPPMIVVEADQSMLYIKTRDFSFVAEQHLKEIFRLLDKYHIKVNMMRNTAISFTMSTNTVASKLELLVADLRTSFDVDVESDLELVTVRHYDQATINRLTEGKMVMYEETLRNTHQMVIKDVPPLVRK